MSSTALLLVAAGALLHAVWNVLAKQAGGGVTFIWLFGIVSLVVFAPFAAWQWLLDPGTLGVAAWLAVIASSLIHIAYSLVLQKGYRESDFSVVYPVARGSGPLFAVCGAMALLGERPGIAAWTGIAAIVGGILLVAGRPRLAGDSAQVREGIVWGALTGITIGAYTLVDGWAIKALGLEPVLYFVLGLALRSGLLLPSALRSPMPPRLEWQRNRRAIIGIGVLSPLAYFLVLSALRHAPLSLVAPLREISMLVGVLIGALVLHERVGPRRWAGVASMLAGAVLIARG